MGGATGIGPACLEPQSSVLPLNYAPHTWLRRKESSLHSRLMRPAGLPNLSAVNAGGCRRRVASRYRVGAQGWDRTIDLLHVMEIFFH